MSKRVSGVPGLPKIPKMHIPTFSNIGLKNRHSNNAHRMSDFLKRYTDGMCVNVPDKNSMFTRTYGCKMCPYWGSSRCYFYEDGVIPPKTHLNGMCPDRLEEIMVYMLNSKTYTGKVILRTEVLHKISNHIMMLEANLSDYRAKKSELKETIISEDPQDELDKIMFDEYEQKLMTQIEQLSKIYGDQINEEMKVDNKIENENKTGGNKITFQQFNLHIADAAKKLKHIEYQKNKSNESKQQE